MAITGGRITASIYRVNSSDLKFKGAVTGVTKNFPNVGVMFYDITPGTTVAGVQMNAIIEVLPSGLVVDSKKYYTPSTAAQILANGS